MLVLCSYSDDLQTGRAEVVEFVALPITWIPSKDIINLPYSYKIGWFLLSVKGLQRLPRSIIARNTAKTAIRTDP